MATARPHVSVGADFAQTGKIATIALVVAAILVGIVLAIAIAYLSSRGSLETGPAGMDDRSPVTRVNRS